MSIYHLVRVVTLPVFKHTQKGAQADAAGTQQDPGRKSPYPFTAGQSPTWPPVPPRAVGREGALRGPGPSSRAQTCPPEDTVRSLRPLWPARTVAAF